MVAPRARLFRAMPPSSGGSGLGEAASRRVAANAPEGNGFNGVQRFFANRSGEPAWERFWLGRRDSNPDTQIQSLQSYR